MKDRFNKKYIASCSFGKDSVAMILKCIETGIYNIDEVVFYDTGMEFQAIYNVRDKLKGILKENNIKYVELKPNNTFEYDMFERLVRKRDGSIGKGYSWCGGMCRWGTTRKLEAIDKYCQSKDAIQLIGIAYDELNRYSKDKNKINPLVELKMTEEDCLKYCYQNNIYWYEDGVNLYDILDRVSCWCCRNKNLKELRNYYLYLPKYWNKLKQLQDKTKIPFYRYKGQTIYDLENRFRRRLTNGRNRCKRM